MEIGVDSFAAILRDPTTGRLPSANDRMVDLIEEVEVADRAGLDPATHPTAKPYAEERGNERQGRHPGDADAQDAARA